MTKINKNNKNDPFEDTHGHLQQPVVSVSEPSRMDEQKLNKTFLSFSSFLSLKDTSNGFTPHLFGKVRKAAYYGLGNCQKGAGFTLVEIIMGIGLMTIVVFIISSFGLDLLESQVSFSTAIEIQQEIQQTLRMAVPEIRSMGPSNNGSYPISVATSNSLQFYSDVNGNGTFERVTYFADGTILKKRTVEPSGNPAVYNDNDAKTQDLIHNLKIGMPIFTYYDANYSGTEPYLSFPADPSEIREIRIDISVDPKITGSSELIFSAQVTPRNL